MLKKLAAIGLATSIGFALIVFTPVTALAQPTIGEPRESTPAARAKVAVTCTKEAGAKGLHGKPRKKFIAECKKGSAAE
jgi:hypothetical protein